LITLLALSVTSIQGSKDWWNKSFDAPTESNDIIVIRSDEDKKMKYCLD